MDDWRLGWIKAAKAREGPLTLDQLHQQVASEDMKQKETALSRTGSQAFGIHPAGGSRHTAQDDDFTIVGKKGTRSRHFGGREMGGGPVTLTKPNSITGALSPAGACDGLARLHRDHAAAIGFGPDQNTGGRGGIGMQFSLTTHNGKQASHHRGDSSEPTSQRGLSSYFDSRHGRDLSAATSMQPLSTTT